MISSLSLPLLDYFPFSLRRRAAADVERGARDRPLDRAHVQSESIAEKIGFDFYGRTAFRDRGTKGRNRSNRKHFIFRVAFTRLAPKRTPFRGSFVCTAQVNSGSCSATSEPSAKKFRRRSLFASAEIQLRPHAHPAAGRTQYTRNCEHSTSRVFTTKGSSALA